MPTVNYQGVILGGMGPPTPKYGIVTEQHRDLKATTAIDWAALNKSMRETAYKGLVRQAAMQQTPFESEWHRLLKQSQVQQEASRPMPDLMEIQRETIRRQSQPAPDKTRDIDAALDAFHGICEKKHQQEHIWNMIVLAAESS